MTFFVSDRGFDGFFGDVFEIRWGNTTLGNPGTKWCFFHFSENHDISILYIWMIFLTTSHCFPSLGDAEWIWEIIWGKATMFSRVDLLLKSLNPFQWSFVSGRITILFLVGGLEHFLFFHSVGNVIIPTDEVHHFSVGAKNHQPDSHWKKICRLNPYDISISEMGRWFPQPPTSTGRWWFGLLFRHIAWSDSCNGRGVTKKTAAAGQAADGRLSGCKSCYLCLRKPATCWKLC